MIEMICIWFFNESTIWSSLFLNKLYEHLNITSVHSELVPMNATFFQLVHLFWNFCIASIWTLILITF
jgi:hypothetical protein